MKTSFARVFSCLAAGVVLAASSLQPQAKDHLSGTAKAAPEEATVIYPALTGDVLFSLMAAEIAVQRRQPGSAFVTLMEVARQTKSREAAQRAFEIANLSGAESQARQALQFWESLTRGTPEHEVPQAYLDLKAGRYEAAKPVFGRLLKSQGKPALLFQHIFAALNGKRLSEAVPFLTAIALPYEGTDPAIDLAVSRLSAQTGDSEKAERFARSAVKASPGSLEVVKQAASGLMRVSPDKALGLVRERLEEVPGDSALRLFYAHALLSLQKTGDFTREAETLSRGSLSGQQWMELGRMAESAQLLPLAKRSYGKVLEAPGTESSREAAYARLGVVSERQGFKEEALGWYSRIQKGDAYVPAKLREADIFMKTGRPDRAIAVLSQATPPDTKGKLAIASALTALLNQADQPWQAYEVMQKAAKEAPEEAEFLYDTAMQAMKVDDMQGVEFYMRKFIALKPESATGYNALGYMLADRGENLGEALRLIRKTNSIKPHDAYILDSLGWVHFRLGDDGLAEKYLRESLKAAFEAETAGHLVDVLVHAGKKAEARAEVEAWVEAHPNDPAVRGLREKLGETEK